MNLREVNQLLARASLMDARLKRSDPGELTAMVSEWGGLLERVPFGAALDAMRSHYQSETRVLMPADVLHRVGPLRLTADEWAREEWLRVRGLSEEDLAAMPREELALLVSGGGEVSGG